MKLINLAVITVLLAGTALPMMAQAEVLGAGAQAKLCEEMKTSNDTLVKKLDEAKKNKEATQALLVAALKNPNNAFCIMGAVKVGAPAIAKSVFQTILAILAGNPANDDIIKKLTEENPDLIALGDGDIEPAAGPGDTGEGALTSGVPTNPNENPDQLNSGAAGPAGGGGGTPPASPSNPNNNNS